LTSKVSAVFSDEVIDMKKTQVIDLNESIRRAAALAKSHIQPHRIQLDLKLSAKSPRVLAHPGQLAQTLLDLIKHANDGIVGDGASGTIQITSAVIRDHVLISVIGNGLADETHARLRMRLSRNIIREFGGDLWVSSGHAIGTTFTIDLPSASLN
jgi:C4-dicarboxylate-specific signal transduction histidine kinase